MLLVSKFWPRCYHVFLVSYLLHFSGGCESVVNTQRDIYLERSTVYVDVCLGSSFCLLLGVL